MLARYISPKIARCLRTTLPSYSFCTLPKISFSEFTRVYRRPVGDEEFEYIIEDDAKKVSFTVSDNATLVELKQKLQELSQDIKSVKALSLDLAELADETQLHELSDETYYMILNNQSLCKMVSLERSEAEIAERAYKKREETCQNAGLPFIEQQIILNYLKRVDILNKEALGNRLFADTKVHEGKVDKKLIINNLFEGIIHQKNHSVNNEPEMIANYLQMRNQLEALKIQHEILEKRAHSATKWKMSLGLLLLLGQFGFVGVGTYVVYSWDIMEPMAYFLGLAGSIALSAMYFRIQSDYSNFGFLRHMRDRELGKLYRKHQFPINEMKELEETIEILEKKIKSNILIDL